MALRITGILLGVGTVVAGGVAAAVMLGRADQEAQEAPSELPSAATSEAPALSAPPPSAAEQPVAAPATPAEQPRAVLAAREQAAVPPPPAAAAEEVPTPAAKEAAAVPVTPAPEPLAPTPAAKEAAAVPVAPAPEPAPAQSAPKQQDPVEAALRGNAALLGKEERAVVEQLLSLDQGHVFASWPEPGTEDEGKRKLLAQLLALDRSYHGGLAAYVRNAQQLLKDSKEGTNPYDGYTPSVPHGEKLDFAGPEYMRLEREGLREAASAAFVLVAGGLGERLGYSGIKVALPAESATGACFLQLYAQYILALQGRAGPGGRRLPLAIMTSDDTHARTEALLKSHDYFGLSPEQVTLIKQEKVACLIDSDAHLALEPADRYALQTKPHGHGDVHALLHSSGLARTWREQGFKWVCFFQDTNALVFRALVAALGVSAAHDYDMNSIAVPRKAKEAIGAIAKLTHRDGSSLTINVEYNQLDPLLRSTVNKDGDVNDEAGWSPYPGNINQLVIKLSSYCEQLARTGGVISEFVNPKYKDASKTAFKSSTRLECMMQDYPKALPSRAKVGFTTINQVWSSYSPVKNSPADALAKFKEGNPTHSATSGELDIYKANCLLLQSEGLLAAPGLPTPLECPTFNGMTLEAYPRVVLAPAFATVTEDCKAKIAPGSIRLSASSVLVLDGTNITITGPLELDGALVVRAAPGAKVNIGSLRVKNAGWAWEPLKDAAGAPEEERIRGFTVVRSETKELVFDKPGVYSIASPDMPSLQQQKQPEPAPEPQQAPAAAAAAPAAATAPTPASSTARSLSPSAKPFVPASVAKAKAAASAAVSGIPRAPSVGAVAAGAAPPAEVAAAAEVAHKVAHGAVESVVAAAAAHEVAHEATESVVAAAAAHEVAHKTAESVVAAAAAHEVAHEAVESVVAAAAAHEVVHGAVEHVVAAAADAGAPSRAVAPGGASAAAADEQEAVHKAVEKVFAAVK